MSVSYMHQAGPQELVFPPSKVFNSGHLAVGDGHELFYQEIGNPNGMPVLLVHGGPGAGIPGPEDRYARMHDPHFFRLICLDQRGCGQSRPHVAKDRKKAFHRNDPLSLAHDLERLRRHLNVDRWHLFGASWGSCLSILYASLHPRHVLSLTVSGIWLHTPAEIDWYINRMGLFHPEAEDKFLKALPGRVPRFDRLPHLYRIITGKDMKLAMQVSEAKGAFEEEAVRFLPEPKTTATGEFTQAERLQHTSIGALEIFFMKQHPLPEGWFAARKIVKALKSVKDFQIVQGRYDIVCPPTAAYKLHKAHPHSKLLVAQLAGHTLREEGLLQAVMLANRRLMTT